MKSDERTAVIFRVLLGDGEKNWRTGTEGHGPRGQVIALFPEIPGTHDCATCESYMSGEGHGSAMLHQMMNMSNPCGPVAYGPLLKELERIGYTLRILQRVPRTMSGVRRAALRG